MKICDNGIIRDMTPEEEAMIENLPDPNTVITKEEAYDILIGDKEE